MAHIRCRNDIECKNKGGNLTLPMAQTNAATCRPTLRADTKVAKLCCKAHMKKCKGRRAPATRRGARELLDAAQVTCLFLTLLSLGVPWVGALVLLQICFGERTTCATRCRLSWLQGVTCTVLKQVWKFIPPCTQSGTAHARHGRGVGQFTTTMLTRLQERLGKQVEVGGKLWRDKTQANPRAAGQDVLTRRACPLLLPCCVWMVF